MGILALSKTIIAFSEKLFVSYAVSYLHPITALASFGPQKC